MATPITSLPTQAGSLSDSDVVPVVDVSDTSSAVTGTTKQNTLAQIKAYAQGGAGGGPLLLVASSTADADVQARADYVCDGTDDDVQINAALARGSVQLTDGDYTIRAPITLTEPGHGLYGTGLGHDMGVNGGRGYGTLIEAHSDFSGVAMISVDQAGGYIAGMCTVANLKVKGSGIVSSTVVGVRIKSFQGECYNVLVELMPSHGFQILGNESPDPQWSPYDFRFYSIQANYNGGAGLFVGPDGADIHCSEAIFAHNTGAGIEYSEGSSGQFTQIHCYSNKHAVWFHDGAGVRCKFANCKFEHSQQHGIYFDGSAGAGQATWTQWVNCGFNCNGESVHNTYDHVNFTGSSSATKTQFIGCHFGNSDNATNLARYALNLSFYGSGTVVLGCYFGWPDGTLSNAGVATGMINIGNSTVRNSLIIAGCAGIDDWFGTAGTPSVAAGSNAGTGAPAPALSGNCTDVEGKITFGTGTGAAAGNMVVVTLHRAKNPSGKRPVIVAANSATALLQPYVTSESDTGFTIALASAPASSQTNTKYAVIYQYS